MKILQRLLGQPDEETGQPKGETLTPWTFHRDHIAVTAYPWRQDTWLKTRIRKLREGKNVTPNDE
jgi:hypothetical protein